MTDRRREKRSRLVAGGRSRTRATWLFVNARDVRASRGHLDARSRWRGETVVGILAGLTRAFAARLARASSSRTSPAGLMARPRRKQTTSAAADVVVPDPPPNPKRRRGPAPAKATARDATPAPTPAVSPDADRPLLDLGPLEEGVLLRRPSSRNRSPYVGDVEIVSGPAKGSVCVTHLPNLDSGGKCRPGARLLCRRQPGVGPDTVGPYGTPKCELVCQLLRCDEPENRAPDPSLDLAGDGVWISAHPSIGEKLVAELLRRVRRSTPRARRRAVAGTPPVADAAAEVAAAGVHGGDGAQEAALDERRLPPRFPRHARRRIDDVDRDQTGGGHGLRPGDGGGGGGETTGTPRVRARRRRCRRRARRRRSGVARAVPPRGDFPVGKTRAEGP